MDHYQDIKILADPEFPTPMLMNALFAKLHRILVRLNSEEIGISFPQVNETRPSLGGCLRLHGTSAALAGLQKNNWLMGMRDHVELSSIRAVPDTAQHRRVNRVQVKSNAARLRRRYRKRHQGVTEAEVVALIPDSLEKRTALPFIQLKSESTGQLFRLFLQHQPLHPDPEAGTFNSYGLSTKATIPWF